MSNTHEMIAGGHGHGLSHCKHCLATDREITLALGPICPVKREPDTTAAEGGADGLVERLEWHVLAHRSVMANVKLGQWMSAALEDDKVCDAMKEDIREWFSAGEPMEILGQYVTEAATTIERITAENARQAAEIEGLRGTVTKLATQKVVSLTADIAALAPDLREILLAEWPVSELRQILNSALTGGPHGESR